MPPLSLGHDLSIEACTDLKHCLADSLEQPTLLQLDASATERVHTASLQLLCALFRTRQHAGLETRWVAASPILRESARLLGLSAALGLCGHEPSPLSHQDQIQNLEITA